MYTCNADFKRSLNAVQDIAAPIVLVVGVVFCLLAIKLIEISGIVVWLKGLSELTIGILVVLSLPFLYVPPAAMFLLAMVTVVPALAGIHYCFRKIIK